MANMSGAAKAKSDQLNFIDLGINGEITITVESVSYDENRPQQKVWVYYAGCNNRPYKPSVGMIRVLLGAWGEDDQDWVGKSMKLYGEQSVTFGKGEVGGIRIRSLSHIDKNGYTAFIQKNRNVRTKQTIPLLIVEPVYYNEQQFANDLPAMKEAISSGTMTVEQVIARCNSIAQLNDAQIAQLGEI